MFQIFPLVRNELLKWGGETVALPLGLDCNSVAPSANPPTAMTLLADAALREVSQERLGPVNGKESANKAL